MAFVWNSMKDMASWILDLVMGRRAKVLFLGLDNAGKTTLAHMLAADNASSGSGTITAPSMTPNLEFTANGISITMFDLGGMARRPWQGAARLVDGLVFVVDASDRSRLAEARAELESVLNYTGIESTPIVVIGNKIDMLTSVSESELRTALGLEETTGKDVPPEGMASRPIEVFMASVVRKLGYTDAITWLAKLL